MTSAVKQRTVTIASHCNDERCKITKVQMTCSLMTSCVEVLEMHLTCGRDDKGAGRFEKYE